MAESKKKPDAASKVENLFDLDLVGRLVELMKQHQLGEIDLQQDDQRIRLCSAHGAGVIAPTVYASGAGGARVRLRWPLVHRRQHLRTPMRRTLWC